MDSRYSASRMRNFDTPGEAETSGRSLDKPKNWLDVLCSVCMTVDVCEVSLLRLDSIRRGGSSGELIGSSLLSAPQISPWVFHFGRIAAFRGEGPPFVLVGVGG